MFKQLKIYYFFISLPFVLLLVGATIFSNGIKYTIVRNPHPQINYTIFTIIIVGGILILLNSKRLMGEARTILEFFAAVRERRDWESLQRLADSYSGETSCLLQMVATSGGRFITHQEQVAIENELTNTRSSMLRRNALPSYLTGLLVGMGLLGTFIGLLATLNDITVLIASFADLDMQNASPLLVFRTMIERMKAPMQSMGIAFSASMFGLLGSIIMGLMMVGLRRLQGDMFSVLSSEVARHIEIALAHESVTHVHRDEETGVVASGEVTNVLFRIEERYAEAARSQQRVLTVLVDDIQKQRTDLVRTLTEQTEASNNIRSELQQVGRLLGDISNTLGSGNDEVSSQLSELTVQLTGDARENNKLLTMQLDEQRGFREALDSYNIEERLAEAAKSQQRALSTVISDFQEQRNEMLRALTEQTEANNGASSTMQQLAGLLDNILTVLEKGNGEISSQLSELTVLTSADAKESHLLLNATGDSFRGEIQQLGRQLDASFKAMRERSGEISKKITALTDYSAAEAKESQEQLDSVTESVRSEMQHLGSLLGTSFNTMEQGHKEITAKIIELTTGVAQSDQGARDQFGTAHDKLISELQNLGRQLDTRSGAIENGNQEISAKIVALTERLAAAAKNSDDQLENLGGDVRGDLQQIGSQLEAITDVMEKGTDDLCNQISELATQLVDELEDSTEDTDSAPSQA